MSPSVAVLGAIAVWAPAAGATPPGPEEMSCCSGSACCGGPLDRPCRLAYGVEGTVTDARDGTPIAGARITVGGDVTTTSTVDGTFGGYGNRPETCHLDYYMPVLVEARGYAPYSDALYTSVPLRHLDARLQPLDTGTGFTISGVVAEFPVCENGMGGVTVVLEPLGRRAQTNADDPTYPGGFFAFANVPPGTYTLTVEPDCNLYGCWEPQSVTVNDLDVGMAFCPKVRSDAVRLNVGHITGAPGGTVAVDVALHTNGSEVASVASTIAFADEARIAAAADGTPDCAVAADVGAATFTWLPAGCTPGLDCDAIRAEVQVGAAPPIDGAVFFRCQVAITGEPAGTCYHLLRCLDLEIGGRSGSPLDVTCENGSVTSETPRAGLSFDFAITPEHPVVGDRVELRVEVSGRGGLPGYSLRGAAPLLAGDTSVVGTGPVSGTVTFELDAVQSGTANLVLWVGYETELGCPGSTGFGLVSDESEPFVVEIGAGNVTPTPIATPVVIDCFASTPPLCASGQTPQCVPTPDPQCGVVCACEPCPACPAGQVFDGDANSCACTTDTAPPPASNGETSGGGGCAIQRGAEGSAAAWMLAVAALAFVARRRVCVSERGAPDKP